jgi:dihydrodipicolinate synthase/N-acetylneuraminate lyase
LNRPIAGVLPIVHTPFHDDDSIDFQTLRSEVDYVFSLGADGFGTGMVSELLRLTTQERIELTRRLVEAAEGRGTVIASVGAESTRHALLLARDAEKSGCDAVMAIPPTTSALSEQALGDYFQAIADTVSLPLIVQDASGYVGQAMPLSLCVALLQRYGPEKILFKPEAQPIGPNVSALRDAAGGAVKIYEGSGGMYLVDAYRRGVAGAMPGVDLLDGVIALWRALRSGNEADIYRLYFPICALIALQLQAGLDGFLQIEKYVLVRRGVFSSTRCRGPSFWKLDDETRQEVDRLLAQLQAAINVRSHPT